jgi:hypothetical protein
MFYFLKELQINLLVAQIGITAAQTTAHHAHRQLAGI